MRIVCINRSTWWELALCCLECAVIAMRMGVILWWYSSYKWRQSDFGAVCQARYSLNWGLVCCVCCGGVPWFISIWLKAIKCTLLQRELLSTLWTNSNFVWRIIKQRRVYLNGILTIYMVLNINAIRRRWSHTFRDFVNYNNRERRDIHKYTCANWACVTCS